MLPASGWEEKEGEGEGEGEEREGGEEEDKERERRIRRRGRGEKERGGERDKEEGDKREERRTRRRGGGREGKDCESIAELLSLTYHNIKLLNGRAIKIVSELAKFNRVSIQCYESLKTIIDFTDITVSETPQEIKGLR